jgi:pyruvate ferredoxin oxidoreductase delta subunit
MIFRKQQEIGAVITNPGNSVKNLTGGWRSLKPVKDKKKCTNCGICWQFCPDSSITDKFEINYKYCKGCGICAKECVFGAIKMEKEEK